MKIWNTKNCKIYQLLEGRNNSFLINSQNNYILIDTGRANSWEKLSNQIDEILGKNKLSCLILTHTHFDHVENAAKIKEKYMNEENIIPQRSFRKFNISDVCKSSICNRKNQGFLHAPKRSFKGEDFFGPAGEFSIHGPKNQDFSTAFFSEKRWVGNAAKIKEKYKSLIIVHQSESEYIMQGNSPLPKGSNLATGFMTNVLGKKLESRYQYEKVDPDILVDEKYDLIDWGFNAYIIHTSGHSKGSMSIIIDNEIAIVGDAMFGVFGNSIYPPFADDPETMVKSWNKLMDTTCDLFLPGHGKEISRKLLENQYEKYK